MSIFNSTDTLSVNIFTESSSSPFQVKWGTFKKDLKYLPTPGMLLDVGDQDIFLVTNVLFKIKKNEVDVYTKRMNYNKENLN